MPNGTHTSSAARHEVSATHPPTSAPSSTPIIVPAPQTAMPKPRRAGATVETTSACVAGAIGAANMPWVNASAVRMSADSAHAAAMEVATSPRTHANSKLRWPRRPTR